MISFKNIIFPHFAKRVCFLLGSYLFGYFAHSPIAFLRISLRNLLRCEFFICRQLFIVTCAPLVFMFPLSSAVPLLGVRGTLSVQGGRRVLTFATSLLALPECPWSGLCLTVPPVCPACVSGCGAHSRSWQWFWRLTGDRRCTRGLPDRVVFFLLSLSLVLKQ